MRSRHLQRRVEHAAAAGHALGGARTTTARRACLISAVLRNTFVGAPTSFSFFTTCTPTA